MTNLAETIEKLERDLAIAKAQHAKDVIRNRPQAAKALADIKTDQGRERSARDCTCR
ncbi:hypothetical protein vB_PsyM_KIL5_0144 [Pseudomonas phage vB_PsyM_KIL5]|uniref:Uncharacterized protein n=1 Tax=Pseudomonas phage vB_PsyM_KIL5 TaxID=1777070 RepID=A0A142IFN0_9CAUD|nr:hypothetical protein vB_PsyM_KIL5_0144 [Pseudomonas phage vB_PsyM_KIL5]